MSEWGVDPGSSTPAWQHTNVWAGGQLLATYDPVGLHFYLDDPLGTRRVTTGTTGVVEASCSSLPYGDGESCAPTPTEHLFTGKERDQESGNDYFGARYYASTTGRFLSPDWSKNPQGVPYADYTNPQTLNLYQYIRNNPLGGVDPDGHDPTILDEEFAEQVAGLGLKIPGQAAPPAQRRTGDPTLPTSVQAAPNVPDQVVSAMTNPTAMNLALLFGTEGVEEIPEAAEALSETAGAAEVMLTRYGTEAESTIEKLTGDAAKAEDKIGIHGVSTKANPKPTIPGGSAPKSLVEKSFPVEKTAGPGHYTVVLPKPITSEIVQIFNSIFWP